MKRSEWEDWKERNEDWYLPIIGWPIVLILGIILFWLLPLGLISWLALRMGGK